MFAAVLSGLCIIFPALMGAWMVFIPRSPEYLVTRGDMAGARQSLQWFRGGAADVQGELQMNVREDLPCLREKTT